MDLPWFSLNSGSRVETGFIFGGGAGGSEFVNPYLPPLSLPLSLLSTSSRCLRLCNCFLPANSLTK